MRIVFAFLAVMALLVSPVAAAGAQAACGQAANSVPGMGLTSMPGMNGAVLKTSGGDPCCDHSAKHSKTPGLSCAQACAATCAVAVALAPPLKAVEFVSVQAAVPTPRAAFIRLYEPQGLKRPPKSMG